jgi:hypothetical protein
VTVETINGPVLYGIPSGCPSFADDVTLICLFKRLLQTQIDICNTYSNKWRLEYNVNKCECIAFGKTRKDELEVQLGGQKIPQVQHTVHVGVPLATNEKSMVKSIQDRIKKARRGVNAMLGIGLNPGGINPYVASKLYWAVIAQGLFYGLELIDATHNVIEPLEQAHRQFAKQIQGLPISTSNPAPLAPLGWWSAEGYLDRRKLMFIWSLFTLPILCVYKVLLIARITDIIYFGTVCSGPISNMYKVACKYGLDKYIKAMLETGLIPPKIQWKQRVIESISKREYWTWKGSCLMYKKLHLYRDIIEGVKPTIWYNVCKKCPRTTRACKLIVKLISGESGLNENSGNFNRDRTKLCPLCKEGKIETVLHFLIDCKALEHERTQLWTCMLEDGRTDIIYMCDMERMKHVLGMKSLEPNINVLVTVAKTIQKMYQKRKEIIQSLINN